MTKLKKLISRLKSIPKTRYIAILSVIVLAVAIAIPTLSRYKNRIDINALLSDENNWDGTVAASYRNGSGTSSDPYIISNAKELAYFEKMLHETSYENTYFELANDIIINNGTLEYTKEHLLYTVEKTKFYLKEYTTEIYQNSDLSGEKTANINKFNTLNNFKGHFNGNYYSIYGLYITDENSSELALFNNLKGTVENLYLENILIYGGSTTASLATSISNSNIKDVFIDGDIVGTTDKVKETEIITLEDVTYNKTETELTENLTLPISTKTPVLVKLTGTYETTSENQKIFINNQEITSGEFTINLNNLLPESLSVKVTDEIESTITLNNLKYHITTEYDTYAVTAGVVAKASSSTLTNIINKANVYGTNESAGIVATSTNTDLTNAYNTGHVEAVKYASGLIGTIAGATETTNIQKTYNAGTLEAVVTNSFINKISNNSKVNFTNSFSTTKAMYSINEIKNTEVEVNNILDASPIAVIEGEITTGEIKVNAESEDFNHDTLKETLNFKEYIDSEDLKQNEENVWVYEEGYNPILYFDDLNNPIATLYVGTYSWNNLGYELRNLYIKNQVGFRIVSNDELNTFTAYYHIHNGTGLKTREEVGQITDWTLYENMVKIEEEGNYTIYVKIVDKNDQVTYINSERLVIDLNEPVVKISMNDETWSTLKESPSNVNILEKVTLNVEATGGYADVTSIKYFVSNEALTEDSLTNLASEKWQDYKTPIEITECGNYIVYVRVTDAADRVKYISTDNLVFGGYTEEISLFDQKLDSNEVNITSKSSITYTFKYTEERTYQDKDTNNFVTNMLLPVNTVITLFDNTTKEVFKYKVTTTEDLYNYESSCTEDNCEKLATYPLNKFVKVGQTDKTKVFNDETYTARKDKNLSITLDFSKTEITETISLKVYLELRNSSNESVVSTLKDSIKKVNIYPNQDMEIKINNLSEDKVIYYNSDSETEITLESFISNKLAAETEIYDTTKTNKKLGLAISLIDKDQNIVQKEHLKNIAFKIGDNLYSPDNDGITRINVSNNTDKTEVTLKIATYLSNTKLDLGDYNFQITPFIASDGKYTSNISSESILIPVKVTNKQEVNYGFNALITVVDEENVEHEFTSIISKTKENGEEIIEIPTTKLKIRMLDTTNLKDKNIKVSLYKRATTIATDQTYELIDLKDYVNGNLNPAGDMLYSLTEDSTIIELNNKKFSNNGYELRFELFDGDRKITTIKKKFITK